MGSRSALRSESFIMVHSVYIPLASHPKLSAIFDWLMFFHTYTVSRSPYYCFTSTSLKAEDCLLIELHMLRHLYDCGKIAGTV